MHKSTSFFLLLIMSDMVFGMPRIQFQGLPDAYGVRLITPSSEEFRGELENLSLPVDVELIQGVLPFAVLVKNATTQRIIAFVVRYRIRNTSGQLIWRTLRYMAGPGPLGPDERYSFGPGKSFFVCPVSVLNRATTHGRLAELPKEQVAARIASVLPLFLSQQTVEVFLDSVMFEDGGFAGPDGAKNYILHAAEFRAESEFKDRVRTLSGEQLAAYLDGLGETVEPAIPFAEWSEIHHYQTRLRELAQGMLMAVRTRGEEPSRSSLSVLPVFPKPYRK